MSKNDDGPVVKVRSTPGWLVGCFFFLIALIIVLIVIATITTKQTTY